MSQSQPIVDLTARRKAATVLRDFISGRITNDDFEERCPEHEDPAVAAIWDGVWHFYDDMKTHTLTGRRKLDTESRRMCIRWLLFLDNAFPYRWPQIAFPAYDPAVRAEPRRWKRWIDLYALRPETAEAFLATGTYAVWPFSEVGDYKYALRHPRRLSGVQRNAA